MSSNCADGLAAGQLRDVLQQVMLCLQLWCIRPDNLQTSSRCLVSVGCVLYAFDHPSKCDDALTSLQLPDLEQQGYLPVEL